MKFKIFILLIFTVSLFACSSARKSHNQSDLLVSQQYNDMDVVHKGFSLSFPNQDEWTVLKNKPHKIIMSKRGLKKDERYLIQALVVKLPKFKNDRDFIKFIARRMKNSHKRSGVKVLRQNAQFIKGQYKKCVQYNSKEQHSAKNKAIFLEVVNFTCRHTDKKNTGVFLAYSKKYFKGHNDKNFEASAARIFNNMNLVSF